MYIVYVDLLFKILLDIRIFLKLLYFRIKILVYDKYLFLNVNR